MQQENLIIQGDVKIHPSAKIWTDIEKCSFIAHDTGRIVIGKNVFINGGAWVRSKANIIIRQGVNIGPRVMIYDNDAHEIHGKHKPGGLSADVILEEYCWIGAGAIILKGVTVGKYAIVGAGSVVTSNVMEKRIYAGNPAKDVYFS